MLCAGKTSLIDILSGRRYGYSVRGDLRVDGMAVTHREMRRISGYVYQDDVLPGTSTVWEYMLFHHSLRVKASRPQRLQSSDIWTVLDQLGLAKVAHSPIGDLFTRGLSGGEKRRVSIATELLTKPQVRTALRFVVCEVLSLIVSSLDQYLINI